jgi:hypothetical protein
MMGGILARDAKIPEMTEKPKHRTRSRQEGEIDQTDWPMWALLTACAAYGHDPEAGPKRLLLPSEQTVKALAEDWRLYVIAEEERRRKALGDAGWRLTKKEKAQVAADEVPLSYVKDRMTGLDRGLNLEYAWQFGEIMRAKEHVAGISGLLSLIKARRLSVVLTIIGKTIASAGPDDIRALWPAIIWWLEEVGYFQHTWEDEPCPRPPDDAYALVAAAYADTPVPDRLPLPAAFRRALNIIALSPDVTYGEIAQDYLLREVRSARDGGADGLKRLLTDFGDNILSSSSRSMGLRHLELRKRKPSAGKEAAEPSS